MNRLARERSPYLLQHAANPVDWFPWGDEAFDTARREQKPIFLSIGYSTCHWCHVMEHESFENAAVAAVLNEHFVPIKVDREERPDVDRVYMTFVQATTGSGGWPMSVWLTPDLKPFYGGTYFPPSSRWGRPGFVEILQEIARVWTSERDKVTASAEALTRELQKASTAASEAAGPIPGAAALSRTVEQFRRAFDPRHGGFGDAPKFPRPSELFFLMREHARTGDTSCRDIVMATLQAMALGGMRDQVGGGFHRYSVDAAWRVPHFEKMLYDQAQLVLAYVEGAQISSDETFLDVAEDTLSYVLREMTDAGGGFYSAEDADSIPPEQAGDPAAHKMEGAFYLWRSGEIDQLAGIDAPVIKRRFGIEPDGNAPFDPQQEFTGKNLLYVARPVEELASEFGRSGEEIARAIDAGRLAMYRVRVTRPRPHLDDKILTAWNGLMIAALARAARVLSSRSDARRAHARIYRDAARKAASFLRTTMWNESSRVLLRRYRDGHAEIDGYAEDYAFLVFGLLELFQADQDPGWIEWAEALQAQQDALFWDDRDGGWFSTTGRDETILLRMKEDYDGAEPSPNSMSVLNLLTLSHLLERPEWTARLERTLAFFGSRLEQVGRGVPMMSAALSAYIAGPQQIVIAGDEAAEPFAAATGARYLPFATMLDLRPDRVRQRVAAALPLAGAIPAPPSGAAAFICQNFACRPAITSLAAFEAELDQMTAGKLADGYRPR